MTADAYKAAGVDLEAQEKALQKIKKLARSTYSKAVLSDVGSFGGLFRLDLSEFEEAVLVSSADGVGTKLMVARMAGDFSTVGHDLVNHCVNDILVQGAQPLFFLDYVGAGVLDPGALVSLVKGVVAGCKENRCALLGGETAEMPGFYQAGDYELVGFIVGLAERGNILDGSSVKAGDLILGLPSAGLHTNGFSLARRILFEEQELELDDFIAGSKLRLRDALLAPHLSYLEAIRPLLGHAALKGLVHVTGGGLTDNLPRVLPKGTFASIKLGTWEIPEIFHLLQELGSVGADEMLRVFNMGIGMALIVDPPQAVEVFTILRRAGYKAVPIGTVQKGNYGVVYDLQAGQLGEEG